MKLFLFCLIILWYGCTPHSATTKVNYIKLYLRTGFTYFGYSFNKEGNAYAETGRCSFFDKPIVVESVQNKVEFKTDSVGSFGSRLRPLKANPIIISNIIGDWRAEIIFEGKLVYDGPMVGNTFWSLILPIANQFPSEMNPLVVNKLI